MIENRPLCITVDCGNVAKKRSKKLANGSTAYYKICASCERRKSGIRNLPKPMYKRNKAAKSRNAAKRNTILTTFINNQKQLILESQNGCGNIDCQCGRIILPLFVYDFHHIDKETKEFEISHPTTRSKEKIIAEIKKCVLLCANCHRIFHFGQSQLLPIVTITNHNHKSQRVF